MSLDICFTGKQLRAPAGTSGSSFCFSLVGEARLFSSPCLLMWPLSTPAQSLVEASRVVVVVGQVGVSGKGWESLKRDEKSRVGGRGRKGGKGGLLPLSLWHKEHF